MGQMPRAMTGDVGKGLLFGGVSKVVIWFSSSRGGTLVFRTVCVVYSSFPSGLSSYGSSRLIWAHLGMSISQDCLKRD